MTPEELTRAVARVKTGHVELNAVIRGTLNDGVGALEIGSDAEFSQPLAELIEAAAEPVIVNGREWCHFCGTAMDNTPTWPHASDCALVALVRAVNGEGER